MTIIYTIFLFFAPCLSQFVVDFNMKPDVTFGDRNERFDVESIIQDQSRMDVGNPTDDFRRLMDIIRKANEKEDKNDENAKEIDEKNKDEKKSKDGSREIDGYDKANEKIVANSEVTELNEETNKREELVDAVKDTVSNLGINNFAYHSSLNSGPDDDDYEKNLAAFEGKRRNFRKMVDLLENIKSGRRSLSDTEDNVLFNYGVPVHMKIQGFLEAPLD